MKKPITPLILLALIIPATLLGVLINMGPIGVTATLVLTCVLAIIASQRYLSNLENTYGYLPKGARLKAVTLSLSIIAFWPAILLIPRIISDIYETLRLLT